MSKIIEGKLLAEGKNFALVVSRFNDFVTGKLVKDVDRLLADPQRVAQMADHNYRVAQKHFSYEVLEDELRPLLRRGLTSCPQQS